MTRLRLIPSPARPLAAAVAFLSLSAPSAVAQYSPTWFAQIGNRNTSGFHVQSRQLAPDGSLWIAAGVLRKHPEDPWSETKSLLLLRFDPNGRLLWSHNLIDNTPWSPIRGALRVDDEGHAFVAVQRNQSRILSRYSPEGRELWRRDLSLDWHIGDEIPLAVDREGGVVVAGNTASVNWPDKDLQVARFDSNGTLRWQSSYAGPLQGYDAAEHVAVDAQGGVHLTAVSMTLMDQPGTVVLSLAFDESGQWLWTTELAAGPEEIYFVHAAEVLADGTRTVAVGAHVSSSNWWPQKEFLLDRIGPTGDRLWTSVATNPPLKSRECRQLRTDSAGNLIFAGNEAKYANPSGYGVHLTGLAEAYSPAGVKLWSQTAMTQCKDTRFEDVLILGSQERVGFVTSQGSEPNCFPLISLSLEFFSAKGEPLDAQRIELPNAGHFVMPTGLVDAEGDLRLIGSANLPGNFSILVASRYTLAGR